MVEILRNLEQVVVEFDPIVLVSIGLPCVTVGLFIWLGGLGSRRLLAAVVGAVSGGICGFFITGRNITVAGLSAGLAATIAVIFEKIFITILATGLAAVLGLAVLAGPYIGDSGDISTEIKQACSQMPTYSWAIIAVLAVIVIVAGSFFWRLTSALCCSVLGTALVFTGMILLLLYKGATPVSIICNRSSYYAAVFVAMIAFGTIEQLLLCRASLKQLLTKKETSKDKKETDETVASWRTR